LYINTEVSYGCDSDISFDDDFLARIDKQAQLESRNRSELLREAVRMYLERRDQWDRFFSLGSSIAIQSKVAEQDVNYEIQAHRKSKRNRNA